MRRPAGRAPQRVAADAVGVVKLNSGHIGALRQQKQQEFTAEMIAFFQESDPFHADALGPDGLRVAIEVGGDLARIDGITQRDPVRLYLQLMFILGGRFAQDPHMPWAARILDPDQCYRSQAARMTALRAAAITHLERTCGKDGAPLRAYMTACLGQISRNEQVMNAAQCADFIKTHYPLKYEFLGPAAVHDLISDSEALCAQAGLHAPVSRVYLTCLRLIYGYWATHDPLLPWIGKLFWRAEGVSDKDAVFEELTQRFLENVAHQINQSEQNHVR